MVVSADIIPKVLQVCLDSFIKVVDALLKNTKNFTKREILHDLLC